MVSTLSNFYYITRSEFEWDCDTCMRDIGILAMAYSYPEATTEWVKYLSGKAYCEDPALGYDENQVAFCKYEIESFMGPAFRSLEAYYTENAQSMCHYWYDSICPAA